MTWLPDLAALIYEVITPKKDEMSESELDEKAKEIQERMDRRDSWTAAVTPGKGYKGERGQFMPAVLPVLTPTLTLTPMLL